MKKILLLLLLLISGLFAKTSIYKEGIILVNDNIDKGIINKPNFNYKIIKKGNLDKEKIFQYNIIY